MFCTQCGRKNPNSAQFCFSCGRALVAGGESAVAAATPLSIGRLVPPAVAPYQRADTVSTADVGIPSKYAGFWIRAAATVIDGFVIFGISVAGAAAFGAAGLLTDAAPEAAAAGYYIAWILASWLYYAVCESSSKQATLGKRAVGIVVTDTSGRALTFGRASGRAFAKWLNAFTLGIGWIVVAFSRKKRGLHDFVAGTFVVQHSRKAGPAMIIALCMLAAVPVIGIVAAIAVPGLLRARMAGNEASAIGSLRAINSAQENYASQCRGYAPTLPSLGTPRNFLSSDLTAAETVTKSGYQFTISPASNSQPVGNASLGCEGAVTAYVVQAVPMSPSTGVRFFATDARGVIYQDTSATFEKANPLQ